VSLVSLSSLETAETKAETNGLRRSLANYSGGSQVV
jgi:hypothetical protein